MKLHAVRTIGVALALATTSCVPDPAVPTVPRQVPDPATATDHQGDHVEPGAAPTWTDVLYVPNGLAGCPSGPDVECGGSQTLDVYEPPGGPTTGRPVIVWIHGGFGIGGDKRDVGGEHYPANLLLRELGRGFVVVSLNYRLNITIDGPDGLVVPTAPIAAEDLDAAVRFLKSNASAIGIDPARIVLWGHSWGAWAAMFQATSSTSSRVAGVIAESGPGDLVSTVPHALAELERTGDHGPIDLDALDLGQLWADSPIRYVDATDAPIYAIVGPDDPLIPLADPDAMADRYAAIGRPDLYRLDVVDLVGGVPLPADWRRHVPHPGANRTELERWLQKIV